MSIKKEKLKPLSEKHRAFLDEYLKDFNAARAYRAVYNCAGHSSTVNSTKIMHSPNFKVHLQRALDARDKATKVDSTYVIEYVKGAAELDLSEIAIIGKHGISIKDFQTIPKEIKKYITEVTATESKTGRVIINFKVFSKEKAIDMLAKHTGATRERVEVSGEIKVSSITDLVREFSD